MTDSNLQFYSSHPRCVSIRAGQIAIMQDGFNFSLCRVSDRMCIARWGAEGDPPSTGAIAEADRRIAAGQV